MSADGIPTSETQGTVAERRRLLIVLGLGALIALFMAGLSFFLASWQGAWQHRAVAYLLSGWFLFCLLSLAVAQWRPARVSLAVWLMILPADLAFLGVTVFIANLGAVLALSLISAVFLLAWQTLTGRQRWRAILSAIIFGLMAFLNDRFLELFVPETQRLPALPWVQGVILAATSVLVLVWGLNLAWSYPLASLRSRLLVAFLLLSLVPLWAAPVAFFFVTGAQMSVTQRNLGLFMGLAATLLVTLLTFLFTGAMLAPIRRLLDVAQRARGGDYSARSRLTRSDELGVISQAYDQVTETLQQVVYELEQRIVERSQLQQMAERSLYQADQLRALAEIARAAASVQSLDRLLPEIAVRTSEAFGFYHVGIFLLDETGKFAVLRAASSEGGKRMLARGHRLEVGQVGIVGYVTATGKPRVALDVGDDAVYFQNPDLPLTRSELALPLKVGERIIGALDVQSTKPEAFRREDIEILSAVADQITLAIENTRLYESTRRSLAEVETFYRQYLEREWGRLRREQRLAGFRYGLTGAAPIERPVLDGEIRAKVTAGEIYRKSSEQMDEPAELAIPLRLRGETIGALYITMPGGMVWTDDEVELVNAVADRLALAMENARLFEQTARRADRERAVAEITSKIRSTNDPQLMLQIAVEELRQVLGAQEIRIRSYAPAAGERTAPFLELPGEEPPLPPDGNEPEPSA